MSILTTFCTCVMDGWYDLINRRQSHSNLITTFLYILPRQNISHANLIVGYPDDANTC